MFWSRSTSGLTLRFGAMRRSGRVAAFGLVVLATLGVACAGKQSGGGMGEDCYRDEDCKVGLVCVANPPNSNDRKCSNDVKSLASSVDGPPPDAGAAVDDAAAPTDDGAAPADPDAGM